MFLFASTRVALSHLVREVNGRGFSGNFRSLNHIKAPSTLKLAKEATSTNGNVIFCGSHNTGKLTILKAIGLFLESEGKKVAYTSADGFRASRLDGYLLYHFLGIRMGRNELPSQDQLDGTLERHMRLVDSTYASSIPSLLTSDVLILDSIEKIHPSILLSMDTVCRRQRGNMSKPFGGLRVYASADFWNLPAHPSSDTGGYAFQLDNWGSLFPTQRLLHVIHGQDKLLNVFTNKAFMGTLVPEEIKELESLAGSSKLPNKGKKSALNLVGEGGAAAAEDDDKAMLFSGSPSKMSTARSSHAIYDEVISNMDSVTRFTYRFPKQPSVRIFPPRFQNLKQCEMGNFLITTMIQSSFPACFGMIDSLNLEVGSRVHLLFDGQGTFGVSAGSVGEVVQIREHVLTVHFPHIHKTVNIPRMHVTLYHPNYPELKCEVQQFPLFPRQILSPMGIRLHQNCYGIHINAFRMADTNDLGNILSKMRSFDDFTIQNTIRYTRLDAMVHEPTRVYYLKISSQAFSEQIHTPLSSHSHVIDAAKNKPNAQWCRNCKSYVPTDEFFSHWDLCVKSVRWCSECDKTIPLELLEPHREKHQVVLCMDCGAAVEWRHWESHRLTCSAMMREISPDNEFLPLRTRQLALELGLDKRDLHTMRKFSRTMLPKPKRRV